MNSKIINSIVKYLNKDNPIVNNYKVQIDKDLNDQKLNLPKEEISIGCGCSNSVPCSINACDREVEFCCAFTIPNGFTINSPRPTITINSDEIACIIEPCTIQLDQLTPPIEIPNPCENDDPLTGCTVKVKRVRLVGCLKVIALIGPISGGFTTGVINGPIPALCCIDTIPVNNVICYTCSEDPCPTGYLTTTSFAIFNNVPDDPCGNKVIKLSYTIFLTPCSQ